MRFYLLSIIHTSLHFNCPSHIPKEKGGKIALSIQLTAGRGHVCGDVVLTETEKLALLSPHLLGNGGTALVSATKSLSQPRARIVPKSPLPPMSPPRVLLLLTGDPGMSCSFALCNFIHLFRKKVCIVGKHKMQVQKSFVISVKKHFLIKTLSVTILLIVLVLGFFITNTSSGGV